MKYLKEFSTFNQISYLSNTSSFNDKYSDEDWDNILKLLKRDCSKFLNELSEYKTDPNNKYEWITLFRGASNVDEIGVNGMWIKSSYDGDRKPKDMSKKIHNIFDSLFKKKFGEKLRSSGIFTTKNSLQAGDYGAPYMFFPIGNYKYYWNYYIDDLFSDIEMEPWYNFDDEDFRISEISKIVDEYIDKDLSKVTSQEVIFICKRYYMVDIAFHTKLIEYLKK